MLRKQPAFTAVAVLTLALGIGANTAIFSIVSWLMLRPMPVPNAEQMVVLAYAQRAQGRSQLQNQLSVPEYRLIRSQAAPEFAGISGYNYGMDGLNFGDKPERLMTCYVTRNFFSVLKLQPAEGRLFTDNEGETPNADPVVVLGYKYWKNRFNGDTS